MKADYHEAAWSVYLEHQDVFAAVLRATGPWQINEGMDLIHDFLVERLPQALVSYDPQRGTLEPWLYTVFIRYARRWLAKNSAFEERMVSLEKAGDAALEQPVWEKEFFPFVECQRVQTALAQLPDHLRTVLLTYFGHGQEAVSIRALARKFKWSRHRAFQMLLEGLAMIAVQLEEQGILTKEELAVCRARFMHSESWEEVATQCGKTPYQVRRLFEQALKKLGTSLERS